MLKVQNKEEQSVVTAVAETRPHYLRARKLRLPNRYGRTLQRRQTIHKCKQAILDFLLTLANHVARLIPLQREAGGGEGHWRLCLCVCVCGFVTARPLRAGV